MAMDASASPVSLTEQFPPLMDEWVKRLGLHTSRCDMPIHATDDQLMTLTSRSDSPRAIIRAHDAAELHSARLHAVDYRRQPRHLPRRTPTALLYCAAVYDAWHVARL